MNTIREAINDYLIMRRGLGFKLVQDEHFLQNFASFMEARGASHVTTELALEWALQPKGCSIGHPAKRLIAVRGFTRYRFAVDPLTEIPMPDLLPRRHDRARPYLYSEAEIVNLMRAAAALPPSDGLRGATYYCLFGLLAVTGLRLGEALALKCRDVDLQQGLLTIRGAKFDRSRLVPLHASTQQVLSDYARRRDVYQRRHTLAPFFISEHGGPLSADTVHRTFCKLSRQIGLRGPQDGHGPRLHDMRHRFATETLLRWYRSGHDVERHLPVLSTFLGHSSVADTYWYVSACPELMGEAVRRLEQRWGGTLS